MSKTSIYARWEAMVQRCTNPKAAGYENYGGRGVKVCTEWLDFARFYADIGDVPYKGATLDRVDNNGDYRKGNVTWAGYATQGANRRHSNKTGFKGVSEYSAGRFRYTIKRAETVHRVHGFTTAEAASIECEKLRRILYDR